VRIVVFGASGGTGQEVVAQALAEGDEVVAVARAGSVVPPGVEVVRAGFDEDGVIEDAVRGADAVVSALGTRGRGPTSVCSDGVGAAIAAMRRTGVRRLLVVSAAGLPGEGDGVLLRWLAKPILQRVLRDHYADLTRMEEIVRASGLDWTIVRPPRLTDGPRTGRYRRALDRHLAGGHRVARADLATELLRAAADRDAVGHLVAIAD
jgi:putative NADH-flavin reductase